MARKRQNQSLSSISFAHNYLWPSRIFPLSLSLTSCSSEPRLSSHPLAMRPKVNPLPYTVQPAFGLYMQSIVSVHTGSPTFPSHLSDISAPLNLGLLLLKSTETAHKYTQRQCAPRATALATFLHRFWEWLPLCSGPSHARDWDISFPPMAARLIITVAAIGLCKSNTCQRYKGCAISGGFSRRIFFST